jgi:hypothetical protein
MRHPGIGCAAHQFAKREAVLGPMDGRAADPYALAISFVTGAGVRG